MIDIKIPIGLMFTILGIFITIYGLITLGSPIYAKTFGINMNLWSGIGMLVFGLLMLAFVKKKAKTQ